MTPDNLLGRERPRPERIALYSIALNLILIAAKYALAILSGSLALKADALHSSSDLVSSAAVLAGIHLSRRRTRAFPYGLYKVKNFVSLGIAGLILAAGYEIGRHAIAATSPPDVTSALPTATGVAAIMAGVFFFYRFEERWGRRLRSPSLVADASEFKVDFLVSAAVVVGLIGARLGLHLDHWVALLIALLVGKTGLVILRDAVRVLLDASLDFATLDRVRTIALDEPEVAAVKELHGRNSGSYKFIEMVVTLRVRQLEHAHEVSHRIEERVREEIAQVDSVLIHYEPLGKKTTTYAVPLLSDREHLSRHFGGAPLFGLITVKRGWLVREEILPNPFFDLEKGKGLKIGRWLLDQDVDAVFSLESIAQRGPGYLFRDVRLEIAPAETYQGVREQILEGAS